jgi:hypothetical protein
VYRPPTEGGNKHTTRIERWEANGLLPRGCRTRWNNGDLLLIQVVKLKANAVQNLFHRVRLWEVISERGERLTDSQPTNVLAASKIWHTGGTQYSGQP